MNLLSYIYHLGLVYGYKSWKMNRYYAKYPNDLPILINEMRKLGREENPYWNKIADDFQNSLDVWKKNNNIKL